MSRRILHIIDSLGRTGTTKQLLIVAGGLARQGFDAHVCALRDPRDKTPLPFREVLGEGISRISFHALGRRWPIDPLADWKLRRLVKRLKPDIVHTWDTAAGMFGAIGLQGLGGWRSSRRALPRSGGRLRGGALEPPVRPRLVAGHYHIHRYPPAWDTFFERRFAPHVAHFVTNSPTVRDWCVSRGRAAEKFSVIPAGVPCASVIGNVSCATGSASAPANNITRDELLRELQLPPDARLIGVVGRLVPDKRVQDLIWAADLLRVLHNNLRLLVIGDGPDRRQLQRYARLASDLEHIQFLGERSDVGRIMPHLDVLWNASENRGQSMGILEAMAAGVPVIASDTPSNRELVVEGETGFLIPLGSRAGRAARARHTDRLFIDAEFKASLGGGAQRRVGEHFDDVQSIQSHVELYDRLSS